MKYFGTDGFRGNVSSGLHAMHAFKIGRYLGYHYRHLGKPRLLIGQDTRISGDMLVHALASGAAAMGCEVYLLGVCPTPAVATLIRQDVFDFGVMISASHNPYQDNGIKIFNASGKKMEADVEQQIEKYLDQTDDDGIADFLSDDAIGQIHSFHEEGMRQYKEWLLASVPFDASSLRIVADLANGSACAVAKDVLTACGAEVCVMSDMPSGININDNCGSTHLEALQNVMRQGGYDIGLAFDGDADRLLAVDELGNVVDGDYLMFLCALDMEQKGLLKDHIVVTTVMSNLGLYRSLEQHSLQSKQVQVGDKYVAACMEEEGYTLGGEQSGHIIFGKLSTTGDGLLTALHVMQIVAAADVPLSKLCSAMRVYPQLLRNIKVNDKHTALTNTALLEAIREAEILLGKDGRILVRPSGTEPLVRVMVEAVSDEVCRKYVTQICEVIVQNKL